MEPASSCAGVEPPRQEMHQGMEKTPGRGGIRVRSGCSPFNLVDRKVCRFSKMPLHIVPGSLHIRRTGSGTAFASNQARSLAQRFCTNGAVHPPLPDTPGLVAFSFATGEVDTQAAFGSVRHAFGTAAPNAKTLF